MQESPPFRPAYFGGIYESRLAKIIQPLRRMRRFPQDSALLPVGQ